VVAVGLFEGGGLVGTAPRSPDADALSLLASWNATGNAETALKQT
jgi:hypothetical protein